MASKGPLVLAVALFLVVLPGCTKSATPAGVSGKVTYKGDPIPAGSITFHMPDGGIFSYPIRNGTYSGTDLPAGEMIVTIETESANKEGRPKATYGRGGGSGGGEDYKARMQKMGKVPETAEAGTGEYVKIPSKYGVKDKSPLRANLTKGKNTNDFDLTD
ncbi:MAG: hypothetical protein ACJ8FY_09190 [Gemmataceae bacterium]